MRTKVLTLAVVAILATAIAGCGESDTASGPPEINFGRDICIQCGMIIDDPRFAAAYLTADGTEKKFDDLGGLIIAGREAGDLEGARIWVSDFEQKALIEARTAFFVPTLGVNSPMGHGILAFGDRARAEAFASDLDGEVIDWGTVLELPVIEGLVGHHHAQDEGMDPMGDHDHEDNG